MKKVFPQALSKLIKEVKKTTDIKEVAELLSQNEWIAISAKIDKGAPILFVLARVC